MEGRMKSEEAKQKQHDLCHGINMIRYCRDHEREIRTRLEEGEDPEALLQWHAMKLSFVQHERLIHFLVTMLTAIAFLFAMGAFLALSFRGDSALGLLLAGLVSMGLLALFLAYLLHYFRLENTVQHWYHIAEDLDGARREKLDAARGKEDKKA